MNIEQKLLLSKRANIITLIDEGLFLRAYNESAYIITGLLGHQFKLSYGCIKKLNNQFIVHCGFPKSRLNTYFKNEVQTDFGFEIYGEYHLYYYNAWLKQKQQAAERCDK